MGTLEYLSGPDQVFDAEDVKYDDVPVPEWGGKIRLRSLSGKERDKFEDSCVKKKMKKGREETHSVTKEVKSKLVVMSAIHKNGKQFFVQGQEARLNEKNAAVLDRLWEACCKLSGFSDEQLEELMGNSESAPKEDSTITKQGNADSPARENG